MADPDDNGTMLPTESREYLLVLGIAQGTVSVLSVLGCLLIITTYLAFKEIRTAAAARHLIFCLAIADLVIAVAGILGVAVIAFYDVEDLERSDVEPVGLCKAQAALMVFGTNSAILWTIALAVYMFVVVVLKKPAFAKKLVYLFHAVCWTVPLGLMTWLAIVNYLGYEYGLCFIDADGTSNATALASSGGSSGEEGPENKEDRIHYAAVIGYELWLCVAFVVLPLLYVSIYCYVRVKVSRRWPRAQSRNVHHVAVQNADSKLLSVPLVFMVLLVWSLIEDIFIFHLSEESYRRSTFSAVMGILVSVGFFGQGLANSILFCVLTKSVREKIMDKCLCCCFRDGGRGRGRGRGRGAGRQVANDNMEESNGSLYEPSTDDEFEEEEGKYNIPKRPASSVPSSLTTNQSPAVGSASSRTGSINTTFKDVQYVSMDNQN